MLPKAARNRLHLRAGTKFWCQIRSDSIVLIPNNVSTSPSKIVRDPKSGLVITQAPSDHPQITSEQVHAALADFP